MIYQCDMDKVLAVLVDKAERYTEMANDSVSSESLYGYLRGYLDATEIAAAVIGATKEVPNDVEYESLCTRIEAYTSFEYASDSNINTDYLENFKKGRKAGGVAAINVLSLVNGKSWLEDA